MYYCCNNFRIIKVKITSLRNKVKKKILVVSYTFPPTPGIGGRRWAKFSKVLVQKGWNVDVIAAKITRDSESVWMKDVLHFEKHISYINSGYPHHLTREANNLIDKIAYRIELILVKLFSKGNYYDRSIFWKKKIKKAIADKIEQKDVKYIVATGAPFGYLSQIIDLKTRFPNVIFIADLRDPWSYNETSYGWSGLSIKRKKAELNKEEKVVAKFDKIITVSAEIAKGLREKHKNCKEIMVIENGYDLDDLPISIEENEKDEKDEIRFVFAGTFYPNAHKYLFDFISGIQSFNLLNLNKSFKFRFQFFGEVNSEFLEITKNIPEIEFKGRISLVDAHKKMNEATYALLFLTDDINYSISTKFCEYILHELPVIVFGKFGYTMQFVEENSLGWGCSGGKDMWLNVLLEIYNLNQSNQKKVISKDSISQLDIKYITEKLINNVLICGE